MNSDQDYEFSLDPDRIIPLQPVYIVWRDHTTIEGGSNTPNLGPVVLHGFSNLVCENDDAYVIAQFTGRDEFCIFNTTSICKESVLRLVRFPLEEPD